LRIWRGCRSPFSRGLAWRYSVGIDVAARVIEVISGRPLGSFLRERLFDPLGMTDTAFGVPPEKRRRLAAMYGRPDVTAAGVTMSGEFAAWARGVNDRLDVSKSYPADSPDVFVRGGHGLFGTPHDYFRFAQMLANGGELDGARILGRKTLELMHSNHVPQTLLPLDVGGLPCPAVASGSARGCSWRWRSPARRGLPASSAGPERRRPTTGSIQRKSWSASS
jgi:CubicO group peptidase (beta-lactamase class C family)